MSEVISARFPDESEVEAVHKAAKARGISPSAFVREAALKAAAQTAKKCPTCGRPQKRGR